MCIRDRQYFTRFQLTARSRGLSATAGLLVNLLSLCNVQKWVISFKIEVRKSFWLFALVSLHGRGRAACGGIAIITQYLGCNCFLCFEVLVLVVENIVPTKNLLHSS